MSLPISPQVDKAVVTWKYDQKIDSDPNLCASVIEDLLSQLSAFDWPDKDTFGIHMAMEEAIMNAMCHGNQRNLQKKVHIKIEIDEQKFFAQITDEGDGFKLADVPDPTAIENIGRTSGRGVRLIQHFMDIADYNTKGNSLTVEKTKSGV